MKETGVSRRIDELGRIVIPKEIRKNLKIREGDQLEFYVEKEYVVLRKKSSLQGLENACQLPGRSLHFQELEPI